MSIVEELRIRNTYCDRQPDWKIGCNLDGQLDATSHMTEPDVLGVPTNTSQRGSLAVLGMLRFSYGTMGSGKSTLALQIHHNLTAGGLNGILCSMHDRQSNVVSSRLGVSAAATIINPELGPFAVAYNGGDVVDYLVCDEVQFYAEAHIEELARVVDELRADVFAFGLLTDFRGKLFPGTARLLELADTSEALQCEARCWCGERATHNARLVNGTQVYEGEVVVVDNPDQQPSVAYELRCRKHWLAGAGGAILLD